MSKGNIQASRSHSGDIRYYLRSGECESYYHSVTPTAGKQEVLQHWKSIEHDELYGNKSLGIRGRHDAQVRTNYMLMMPNQLTPLQVIDRVRSIIEKTPIRDCVYTICVHGGRRGEVEHNQHVHLIVNERSLVTGKKIRELSQKPFLEQFKGIYREAFAVEFAQGKDVASRDRIDAALWKAAPSVARELVAVLRGHEPVAVKEKRVLIEQQVVAQLYRMRKDWMELQKNYLSHRSAVIEVEKQKELLEKRIDAAQQNRSHIMRTMVDPLRHKRKQLEQQLADWQQSGWMMKTVTPNYAKQLEQAIEIARKKEVDTQVNIDKDHTEKIALLQQQLEELAQINHQHHVFLQQEYVQQKKALLHQLLQQSLPVTGGTLSGQLIEQLITKGTVMVERQSDDHQPPGQIRVAFNEQGKLTAQYFNQQQLQQLKEINIKQKIYADNLSNYQNINIQIQPDNEIKKDRGLKR